MEITVHDLSIGELIKKLQSKDGKKIRVTVRRGDRDSKISIQTKEKSLIVGQHAFLFFKRNFGSNVPFYSNYFSSLFRVGEDNDLLVKPSRLYSCHKTLLLLPLLRA